MPDPANNRNLYFGNSITNQIGAAGDNILDAVTISFRARVATGAPLDDRHPDGGGGISPWPAGGDGPRAGLIMNNLNGATPTGGVDTGEGATLNLLSLDPTVWHEFWITIEPDASARGTHLVKIYLDGSPVSNDFIVTAGRGDNPYPGISFIEMGMGHTGQSGAIDVDYFSYKQGVFAPSP